MLQLTDITFMDRAFLARFCDVEAFLLGILLREHDSGNWLGDLIYVPRYSDPKVKRTQHADKEVVIKRLKAMFDAGYKEGTLKHYAEIPIKASGRDIAEEVGRKLKAHGLSVEEKDMSHDELMTAWGIVSSPQNVH